MLFIRNRRVVCLAQYFNQARKFSANQASPKIFKNLNASTTQIFISNEPNKLSTLLSSVHFRTFKPLRQNNNSGNPQLISNLTEHESGKLTEKLKESSKSDTPVDEEDAERTRQNQQQWKMMKYSFLLFGLAFGAAGFTLVYEFSKPVYDEDGNLVKDEFSEYPLLFQIFYRIKREFSYYKKLVQEPSREKLLPDPLVHPYIQPPYTVILEMTDVLVHPDWTYQTGWRFKKRPGVDHFLATIAPPQFEIVVYTAEQGMTVFPILDALDPNQYIMYRLVRDATRFVDGHHVKDLDALNRDLSKVIVIDWNSESVKFHPENTLKIPRWDGNDSDTTLYDLGAFLKTIYSTNVEDIRDVLNYYRQFDNPLEAFRENQRKLLSQLEEDDKMKKAEQQAKLTAKWSPSFLRSI